MKTSSALAVLTLLMGIVGTLNACRTEDHDAADPRSTPPAHSGIFQMQLPRRVELHSFTHWQFGQAQYPDAASIDAEVQKECSRIRIHSGDARFPDFKAIVIPTATIVIGWDGLTDRTGNSEYESLFALIHSSDPRGFTLADFLLQASRVVHASMRDAGHHYLQGIQLHTPHRLQRLEVPPEFQGYPVYILHCGS